MATDSARLDLPVPEVGGDTDQWGSFLNAALAILDEAVVQDFGATQSVDAPLSFPDGSAALPAITNTGDLNTGIYFPTGDTIAVSTNGTERARITSGGNLLIGTTTDSDKKLDVNGGTREYIATFRSTDSQSFVSFVDSSTSSDEHVAVGALVNDLILRAGNAERARITSGGNLLINTTSDSGYKLEVSGSDARIYQIRAGRGEGGIATNTCFGNSALSSNTTGSNLTAFGDQALSINTTGSNNSAFGHDSLIDNEDGSNNTAFGLNSLRSNTSGSSNSALGVQALLSVTTGENNTAAGRDAGSDLTTGSNVTCLGYEAQPSSATATNEVTFGDANVDTFRFSSSDSAVITVPAADTFAFNTGGTERARITSSGYFKASDTGSYPILIGVDHHQFAQSTQSIPIGAFYATNGSGGSQGIDIDFTSISPDDNNSRFLRCLDSTTTRLIIYADGDVVNHDGTYGTISDKSLKQQIVDAESQWDDFKSIRFRKFKFNTDVEQYGDDAPSLLGVVAQELEQVCPGLVKENGDGIKQVKQSILYMKAMGVIQELQSRVEALESQS